MAAISDDAAADAADGRNVGRHVVQMGQKGATDALKSKVKSELLVHELIKVFFSD